MTRRERRGAWRVVADRDVRAAAAQRIVSAGGSLTRLADLQPSLEEVYTRYFQEAAPCSVAPRARAGSPFTGLGPVFMKELADHLSSVRMMVLTLFVIVFGALPGGLVAAASCAPSSASDAFLFLRIFTSTPEQGRSPFLHGAELRLSR